jgi:hypothetical protein
LSRRMVASLLWGISRIPASSQPGSLNSMHPHTYVHAHLMHALLAQVVHTRTHLPDAAACWVAGLSAAAAAEPCCVLLLRATASSTSCMLDFTTSSNSMLLGCW